MNDVKITMTALFTGITVFFSNFLIPIAVLLVLMTMDYITALSAAKHRGQAISSVAFSKGIYKKVSLLFLVFTGATIDWLLMFSSGFIGIEVPFKFAICVAVTIWIICNELISILENIADTGVKLPKFLMAIVAKIRNKIDK